MIRGILVLLLLVAGCVGKDAVTGVERGAVEAKIGVVSDRLETLLDQTSSIQNTAESINQFTQEIKQQAVDKLELLHRDIQADTINYGGAGWAVAASSIMTVLFLGATLFCVWLLIRGNKFKTLLTLVTRAVQKSPDPVKAQVKEKVEEQVGPFKEFWPHDKQALARFTRLAGTFAMTPPAEVKHNK